MITFFRFFLEDSEFRNLFVSNFQKEFLDNRDETIIYAILKGNWIVKRRLLSQKELEFDVLNNKKYAEFQLNLLQLIKAIYELDITQLSPNYVREKFLEYLRKTKLQLAVKKIVEEWEKDKKSYIQYVSLKKREEYYKGLIEDLKKQQKIEIHWKEI